MYIFYVYCFKYSGKQNISPKDLSCGFVFNYDTYMEKIFTVTFTMDFHITVENKFNTVNRDPLVYKSSFLNYFESDLEDIEEVNINDINEQEITGVVTVIREKVFKNPEKDIEDCVIDYLRDTYLKGEPKFDSFELQWITIEETRTETIVDTDSFLSEENELSLA